MDEIELLVNEKEYCIVNRSNTDLSYGANFELEKKIGEGWESVLEPNRPCILILYHLGAGMSESYPHHLELQAGEYRFSKNVSRMDNEENVVLVSEFKVEG